MLVEHLVDLVPSDADDAPDHLTTLSKSASAARGQGATTRNGLAAGLQLRWPWESLHVAFLRGPGMDDR